MQQPGIAIRLIRDLRATGCQYSVGLKDSWPLGSDQMVPAQLDGLEPFDLIAHADAGHAEEERLLLHATGVG